MNILAVDSVSALITVTLKKDENIFVKNLENSKNASEFLLVLIDEILTENNLTLNDVDYLSINVGPGSFTGIRIAMSLFKGFMVSKNIKCVTVNSFELLSYNILDKNFVVALNSGTSDYYCMIKENGLATFYSYNAQQINKLENDFNVYSDVEIAGVNSKILTKTNNAIIDCTIKKINNNEFKNEFELEPLYVKKAQSEREYKQKFLSQLTVEKATIDDLNDVFKMEQENFEDAYSLSQIETDIEKNRMFVAKSELKVVGYISFTESDDVEILKICTDKNYRNLGVGEALIKKIEEFKKDIYLEVNEHNSAKNFYAKNGFKLINVRKKYYKNADALIMKKQVK